MKMVFVCNLSPSKLLVIKINILFILNIIETSRQQAWIFTLP